VFREHRTALCYGSAMAGGASIANAIRDVTQRAKRLAKLQMELARAEVRAKGRAFGVAIGMFVAAAMLGFFALALVVALLVAVLAIVLPLWLAILIVLLVIAGAAGALGAIGARSMKRSGAPAPVRAIAQAKRTQAAVRDALRPKPVVIDGISADTGAASTSRTEGSADAS
jgi:Putative Actinobacterial Holin-X, holin superfamily III